MVVVQTIATKLPVLVSYCCSPTVQVVGARDGYVAFFTVKKRHIARVAGGSAAHDAAGRGVAGPVFESYAGFLKPPRRAFWRVLTRRGQPTIIMRPQT